MRAMKEGKAMVEVYVYSEGSKPIEVVLGRRHAVDRLVRGGFKTTAMERTAISRFLEGGLCDLGSGIQLVGYTGDDDVKSDRKITRVVGPGTEV